MTDYMRILSVRQPWASLIVHGHKALENRSWTTSYRGPILIHSGARLAPPDQMAWAHHLMRDRGIVLPDQPLGSIIGLADLVDCLRDPDSDWHLPGTVAWILAAARPITPITHRGRLGLYSPPPDLAKQLHALVA